MTKFRCPLFSLILASLWRRRDSKRLVVWLAVSIALAFFSVGLWLLARHLAWNFKTLVVSSAWKLYGMHPGIHARHFWNREFEFSITTTWDGNPVDHSHVGFVVSAVNEEGVKVDVSGPLFNDPGPPPAPPGSPCPELWEYEVAEIFFLGAEDKYLEVELCPHGQHLVLLLNGTRNMIKDKLALDYTATVDNINKTWQGTAIVPLDYFPPGVSKVNAYAIHGSGDGRQYEALYPATKEFNTPDFHRLQFFKEFNFNAMFPATWKQPDSTYWSSK